MSNPNGRFGVHGGQYIPETLMNAVTCSTTTRAAPAGCTLPNA